MRKRIGITLVLVAVLVAGIAVPNGSAAGKKSHNAKSHVTARTLKGNIVTGTTKGKLASGAVIYTVSGVPSAEHLKITAFYPLGTIKAKATVAVTGNPDGSANVTGNGTFTGGTGAYKGSTGSFKTTGKIASDGLITADITGNVKY